MKSKHVLDKSDLVHVNKNNQIYHTYYLCFTYFVLCPRIIISFYVSFFQLRYLPHCFFYNYIFVFSLTLLHKPLPQNAPAAPAMVSELPPSFVFSSVCLLSFWFSSSPHCLSCFQPMAIDVYHISFPQKTVVSEHGGSCVFQWK